MKRGEIWTVAGDGKGGKYARKPRPAVVLQADEFAATHSVTVCLFTSKDAGAPLFRVCVAPDPQNGLKTTSYLMVDKITTVPRSKIGKQTGVLNDKDLDRMNRAVVRFLGLAGAR